MRPHPRGPEECQPGPHVANIGPVCGADFSHSAFRIPRSAIAFLLLCLLLSGCAGYHLGPTPPHFMEGIRTIAVPTFRNETLIPRIEVLVADTVIRQIQQDGTYKVATSPDDADAVLEAEILQVVRRPERTVLNDVQATQEFQMTLVVHYKIIRKATGETVDDKNATGSTTFFVSGDVNQGRDSGRPPRGPKRGRKHGPGIRRRMVGTCS